MKWMEPDFKDLALHASNQTDVTWFSETARMWSVVVSVTTLLLVVEGQKRPTISFISGAGSGEVVTDLGKSAELICQVRAYVIKSVHIH